MFDTRNAIVLLDNLATWQKLKVTAFLMSGIVSVNPDVIGEPYRNRARDRGVETVAGVGFELRGIGSVLGTAAGALLIGVLLIGLVMLNVKPFWQQIVIGIIIVAAVAFDTYVKSLSPSNGDHG